MMKLNKHEDVLAMVASVNARVRSWRPDNRRTRAEVVADLNGVYSFLFSVYLPQMVSDIAAQVVAALKAEQAANELARRAILCVAQAPTTNADVSQLADELLANRRARQRLFVEDADAGTRQGREFRDIAVLDSALRAALDKAAP